MGNNVGNMSLQKFKKELEERMEPVPIYPPPNAKVTQSQSRRPTKQVSPQHAQKMELDAEPIQGNNEKLFYVVDGRRQILETAKWPNSVHGVIAVDVNGMTAWGTGIMIGPHIVLTAGHNLYHLETQTFTDVKTIRFLPGMNGKTLPFGAVKVEQYFVSPNYIKHGKQDYGILVLKKRIGEMTGYFGLACLDEPEEIKGKKINVTGYPGDKVIEKPNTYEMWSMEGEASEVDQETGNINYLIDTGEGQNGSGVWYKEGEEYYVCGVHRGAQFVNQATLLTRDIYRQIYAWLQEVGFKESVLRLADSKSISLKLSEINPKFLPLLINYKLDDLQGFYICGEKVWDQELKILAQKTSWSNLSHLDLQKCNIGAEGAKGLAQNTSWVKLSVLILARNNLGAEGASALGQNTSWINLSRLKLEDNNIKADGAKGLAQNTSWVNLGSLELSKNYINVEGASALGQNTSWINLSWLELEDNNIKADGAKGLAQNTSWVKLSKLLLRRNYISAEGLKGLAQNTSWVNLSWLDLKDNDINADGAKALAQNTSWINLSVLDLSENGSHHWPFVGELKGLAQNSSWINLSVLDLSFNRLLAKGLKGLAQNTSWVNLSRLSLKGNYIGADGAKVLAQNTSWINLSALELQYNDIGAEGAKVLAQNTSWIKLSVLELERNNIGAEGAKVLAQNTSWIKLLKLRLKNNNIGADGAKALAQNTSWTKLSSLNLSCNDIGVEGAKALVENTSWIKLSLLDLGQNNIISDDIDKIFEKKTGLVRIINIIV